MNFLIASDGDRGNRSRIAGAVLLAVVCGMLIGGCTAVAVSADEQPLGQLQVRASAT